MNNLKTLFTTACMLLLSFTVFLSSCDEQTTDDERIIPALDAPSLDIVASSVAENGFTITWAAIENADYYECRIDGGTTATTEELAYTFTNLKGGTSYKAEVRACSLSADDYSASSWSSATVKTLPSTGTDPEPDPNPDPDTDPDDVPEGYTLVWSDEFNGQTLDMDSWNIEVNGDGGGNNELQYYRAENVSISDEPTTGRRCLTLTARKESYGGKQATSGRITSLGKRFFKYGRFDAYIKMPQTANGLWPAYWMMGNDHSEVGWPRCGEIDIVEMGHANGISAGTQDRYFNGACHWGYYKNGAYPNYSRSTTAPYSMQDGFHLFTLIWDENSIRTYYDLDRNPDAEPYFEMGITDTSDDWGTGYYFHKDCFILFNLAVGGNFPAIWNINDVTALANGEACMYVDYVRVYQKK